MQRIVKNLLGERVLGFIDYYRHPEWKQKLGGALNGQQHRQRIVAEFVRRLPLDAIVETGTYCGTTTAYFATLSGLPTYTVESDKRRHAFGFLALRHYKNVHRFKADSRAFLRELAGQRDLDDKTLLFYLDAHWNEDLPLAEELQIIFSHWKRAVVLVDDFKVDGDAGYTYDDYGPGKTLNLDYIATAMTRFSLSVFFPSLPSGKETGMKRGSVTLASDTELLQILRQILEIREHSS